jgi:hypothetical protein
LTTAALGEMADHYFARLLTLIRLGAPPDLLEAAAAYHRIASDLWAAAVKREQLARAMARRPVP